MYENQQDIKKLAVIRYFPLENVTNMTYSKFCPNNRFYKPSVTRIWKAATNTVEEDYSAFQDAIYYIMKFVFNVINFHTVFYLNGKSVI